MTKDEVIEWLTQWGIANRVHNINGWPSESVLYKIERDNVYRPYIATPNTQEMIDGKGVGENKQKVGADPKQIDHHKVKAIESIMEGLVKNHPLSATIASKVYVFGMPERQIAETLSIGRQMVRSAHTRLIIFIQNELELKNLMV